MLLYRGWPHLGFMLAQTLHSRLRRVSIVAATVAPITLAAAGVTVRAEPGVAPFDGSLQRLAEILGALHYLRNICGANEGQKWRSRATAPAHRRPTWSFAATSRKARRSRGR